MDSLIKHFGQMIATKDCTQKEKNLPLLIKTTIHMLEMEAQRQPSIGDAQEDLVQAAK